MPTSPSSMTFKIVSTSLSGATAYTFLMPARRNPVTNSSVPTTAICISHHQQVLDDRSREGTRLASRDYPDVVHFHFLAYHVVHNREDRERVEVGEFLALANERLIQRDRDARELPVRLETLKRVPYVGVHGGLLELLDDRWHALRLRERAQLPDAVVHATRSEILDAL